MIINNDTASGLRMLFPLCADPNEHGCPSSLQLPHSRMRAHAAAHTGGARGRQSEARHLMPFGSWLSPCLLRFSSLTVNT